MTRLVVTAALFVVLAACGSNGGNAAIGKTFTYGTSAPLSSTQATTLQAALQGALAVGTSSDPSTAESFSDVSSVTSALLQGGTTTGFLTASTTARSAALSVAGGADSRWLTTWSGDGSFDNPGCVVKTDSTVTLKGCSLTITDATARTTITADGTASLSAGTITWDFAVAVSMSETNVIMTAHAHRSGRLTATPTTLVGQLLGELSASATAAGQSESIALSESVALDLGNVTSTCIGAGTLEAKRVWTERPSGATGSDYADRAALVTWTGCGIATIALSG